MAATRAWWAWLSQVMSRLRHKNQTINDERRTLFRYNFNQDLVTGNIGTSCAIDAKQEGMHQRERILREVKRLQGEAAFRMRFS